MDAWTNVKPRTMVDHAIDAIIEGAARGLILPGERIVESELASRLGMSRVPMREAFRTLASQGVLTIEPYKGIRLMPVTSERVDQLQDARIALETRAATQALSKGNNQKRQIDVLWRLVDVMELMATRQDAYGFAMADTDFHRHLVRFSGNPVLSQLWESLALQLTIIFGLSTLDKTMKKIIKEHTKLIEVFVRGEVTEIQDELEDHILRQTHEIDFERVISDRRKAKGP
ncbi:MAG: GntR family transcriptional regulator [Pseudomonadota bacterium]